MRIPERVAGCVSSHLNKLPLLEYGVQAGCELAVSGCGLLGFPDPLKSIPVGSATPIGLLHRLNAHQRG